ncbi:hemin uptake protein HemP [Ancylobacter terrae]|uniref:hemin uptake protein HemP n=1 Tax=Ancylobacter sp. sgz301288 TaxID=3342077 RepID=UPI003859F27C
MTDTEESGNRTGTPAKLARRVSVVDQTIDSRDLFIATKEITIAHRGERYRLRLTAQNKLILTK